MSVFDEFVKSCHGVLRLVMRSVKFLDVGLKSLPVGIHVTREEFNRVFDFRSTVVWKMSAALSLSKAKVLAFNISFIEEFRGVFIIELHSTRLLWMRHNVN